MYCNWVSPLVEKPYVNGFGMGIEEQPAHLTLLVSQEPSPGNSPVSGYAWTKTRAESSCQANVMEVNLIPGSPLPAIYKPFTGWANNRSFSFHQDVTPGSFFMPCYKIQSQVCRWTLHASLLFCGGLPELVWRLSVSGHAYVCGDLLRDSLKCTV